MSTSLPPQPPHLLAIFLSASVPLRILALQEQGGPDAADWARLPEIQQQLGEHGDRLLFGGGKQGEVAALANGLAHAIAVMAFVPGGITVCNVHYEAKG